MNYELIFVPLRTKIEMSMFFFNKSDKTKAGVTSKSSAENTSIKDDAARRDDDATTARKEESGMDVADAASSSNMAAASSNMTASSHTFNKNDVAFQQMLREEAKRLRITEQLLSASHLARIQDALRLNETKMENIEENLDRTRKQLERVHRYQELSMELHEQKKHLYEVNKQLASSIKDKEDLERFEEFENVQGRFQRLGVLEMFRKEQRQRATELARNLDVAVKSHEEESKRLKQCQDEASESSRKLLLGIDAISEAQQIEGRTAYMTIVERKLTDQMAVLTSKQTVLEKEIEEQCRHLSRHAANLEALRIKRQSLAPHLRMADHGELILERLSRLSEYESELQKAEQILKECTRKSSDENDLLERVYSNYQQIEQEMKALQDELHVHRQNNHGLDSYRLQERAMKLKLRREMLISAQSLWTRIANGYTIIEELTQRINSLRLKHENLISNVNNLSKELGVLRRTCHEKEYTFTLSKSQNVIQLRSDLKEGTSCTVCGATHHPYHSDTMLEQNKLIGEIKMEFESLANELKSKEQQLREMELETSAVAAMKEEAENTLITLRALQNGYVSDWQMFCNLDSSFQTCDSSVNAPARTAMLRQLIENIVTEVDKAQKELDTFNFHQSRINELSEQISITEQKKNELITRLNEVNTGCQVMVGQLERAQNAKQTVRDNYSRLLDSVDKMITIADWKTVWNRSHESLLMRIQEITKSCTELKEKLQQSENDKIVQEAKLEFLQANHQSLLMQITKLDDEIGDCRDKMDEDKQHYEKLVGKENSKLRLQSFIDEYRKNRHLLEEQEAKTAAFELKQKDMQGRLDENREAETLTNGRLAEERQGIDLWMRRYNANHPPVQYSELETMFAADRDWNSIRAQLRRTQMESMLTQARVDKIGSMLVSLQAEGALSGTDADIVQGQLASQIDTLEGRRRETMMQIATLSLQLNAHQKAESLIKEEKMREK